MFMVIMLSMLNSHALEYEYPQYILKPNEMRSDLLGLLNRGDPVDGKLSYILNVVEDLIDQTQEGQKVLRTNFVRSLRIKNETEENYTTSQTNRRSACAALNSSAVQRNLNEALRAEDEANETLKQAHINYSAALKAHEDQNVESAIQSLSWIRTMVYRLLTGTHMPTTSPTTSPTEPPTPSPTNPALSNLEIENQKRMTITDKETTVWIDKDDNIICLGLCGVTQGPFDTQDRANKEKIKKQIPWIDQAMRNDSLTLSMVKYDDLIEEPLFVNHGPDWVDTNYQNPHPSKSAIFGMWGKVTTSIVPRLAGKKPVSVSIGQGLMVLYDDGSIWNHLFDRDNFQLLQRVGFPYGGGAPNVDIARDRITEMSGRGIWPNGPDWWFKVSEDTVFTRISNGESTTSKHTFVSSFAWDINNDFYIFIDANRYVQSSWDILVMAFFRNCEHLKKDFHGWNSTYWWFNGVRNVVGFQLESTIGTRGFFKWPRECYPSKGNVVDVRIGNREIMLLFDNNGEEGNLWGYLSDFHLSNTKEKCVTSSALGGDEWGNWCQLGTNKRVTTMAFTGPWPSLVVATTTGIYCMGRNDAGYCAPHELHNKWLEWTKIEIVNQSIIAAPIKKIQPFINGMLFLFGNGQVWRWEGGRSIKWSHLEYAHVEKQLGGIANMHVVDHTGFVVTNRTGSHIHFGNRLYNCDWQRNSDGELIMNTLEKSRFDTPCGPADDMGPLDEKMLWLQ